MERLPDDIHKIEPSYRQVYDDHLEWRLVEAGVSRSVFHYLDYREYLRDRWMELKKKRTYSERKFAQKAGFKSPSFLKMLIDGKRTMTPMAIEGIAKGFDLSKSERRFFEALVDFNLAENPEAKDFAYQKILQFRKYQSIRPIDAAYYQYLSSWYNVAIREAITGAWADRDPSELSTALEISTRQVEEAIELLLKLGLIEKMPSGKYAAKDLALQTPREMQSVVVRNFHKQMINRAVQAIDDTPMAERELGALTLALTPEKYQELRKRIADFRRQMNAELSGDQQAEQVYQLNFQVFPLLKVSKKGESE